jgi:hypothetical protein
VARLEAGGGSQRHSPTIATLRKYAQAVGCRLEIRLRPSHKGGWVLDFPLPLSRISEYAALVAGDDYFAIRQFEEV